MSYDSLNTADVIIVGGGVAGLMAARELHAHGVNVTVLDKDSGVGGRLATQPIGSGLADYGAQFFTVREPEFQKQVDQWVNEGVVYEWSRGWSDGSLMQPSSDNHPRYAVHGGMSALASYLAQELDDVRVNVQIVTATCDDKGWILQDDDGNLLTSKALVMTPPVPQTLEILDAGATVLHPNDKAALDKIEYAPCLAGIFWLEGRVTLPLPGAVQRKNAPITWIADNEVKGISPNATVVTVQAGDQYSIQMWSAPDERILHALETDMRIFVQEPAKILDAQLKRWQYSRPVTTYPDRCLMAKGLPLLALAGDAFGGPRVEGAFFSGIAAGEALLEML